jgi:hypothetical protein
MPSVFEVSRTVPVGLAIDEILLIAGTATKVRGRVRSVTCRPSVLHGRLRL